MKLHKTAALLLAVAVMLSAAACGGQTEAPAPTPDSQPQTVDQNSDGQESDGQEEDETTSVEVSDGAIVIGGIGPLTGDLASYGVAAMNGAAMYFEENSTLLGQSVVFRPLDDKGDSIEAVNNYNRLVNNDNAAAIIGAVTSAPSSSVATASLRDGTPIITPSGTAEDVTTYGPNMFRACYTDSFQGTVMANFATGTLNAKTAAVIYNNGSEYSYGLYESFVETFKANGGEILAEEAYANSDTDFRSQLTKIAALEPEVLFVPDYYATVALIGRQIQDVGMETIMLGADGWDSVLGVVEDTSVVEGSFFCNHYSADDPDPLVQQFIQNYKETYGDDPNAFSALGYDAAKLMASAIEEAGTTDNEAVVEALQNLSITCLTGNVSFDEDGNPIKGVAIITIEDGDYKMYEKLNP